MKKDLTDLVFILDMSGSMEHLTDDTIGGFNSVLKEHAGKEGKSSLRPICSTMTAGCCMTVFQSKTSLP